MKLVAVLNLVVCLMLATSALADIERGYSWDAPTSGTEAIKYHVQAASAGVDWADWAVVDTETFVVTLPDGIQEYQIRVAGEDSDGRVGQYSLPSDPYSDPGPPGQPGKPSIIAIISAALFVVAALLVFFRKEDKDAE